MELWDRDGRRRLSRRRRRAIGWTLHRKRSTELAVVTTIGLLLVSFAILAL